MARLARAIVAAALFASGGLACDGEIGSLSPEAGATMQPSNDASTPRADGATQDDIDGGGVLLPDGRIEPPPIDAGCATPASDAGPTGSIHDVYPGSSIAAALASAAAGDVVVVHAGDYPPLEISSVEPAARVVVTGASGEHVSVEALTLERTAHLAIRDLTVHGRVYITLTTDLELSGLVVAPLESGGNTLSVDRSSDITIERSRLEGGVRTIVLYTGPLPMSEWVHDVRIRDVELVRGNRCMQVIGARAVTIERMWCHDLDPSDWNVGIQLSGSDDVRITQSRFEGPPGARIGRGLTFGRPTDVAEGGELLTVTHTVVASTLVHGFAENGILLEGTSDTDIVNVTSWDNGTAERRAPGLMTDFSFGGNPGVRLWNDLLETIAFHPSDAPPALVTHVLALEGGSGEALITGDPMFVDRTTYELAPSSPAIDAGITLPGTPGLDLAGRARVGAPDLGALEHGGVPVCE